MGEASGPDGEATYSSTRENTSKKENYKVYDKKEEYMKRVLLRMMAVAKFVLRTLWFISIVWALNKAFRGHEFKNSAAALTVGLSGPPLAHVTLLEISWPSVYFAPHALVCPKHEYL